MSISSLMNYNNTCGYLSFNHHCAKGKVSFISRYHDETDYCVEGARVCVHDDQTTNATLEQRRLLWFYFLDKYAKYCLWHAEMKHKPDNAAYMPALAPFDMGGFDDLLKASSSRSGQMEAGC